MEKEMLYEGKQNASSINLIEFNPQGAKADISLAGMVNGMVTGLIITTHNVLMKLDTTTEFSIKSIIFSNGEPVVVMGKGTGGVFDTNLNKKIEEDLTFQTPSQRLGYLNTTKGRSEGLFNLGTGEYSFKVYAIK
jgi:hypothetical protein